MRLLRVGSLYKSQEVQSLNLKNLFRKIQHFGIGSCCYSQLINDVNNTSELVVTNVEAISSMKSVSKKNNQLSVVEEKDIEVYKSLQEGNILHPYKSPKERAYNVLKNDLKLSLNKGIYALTRIRRGNLSPVYFPRFTDILIIGGGPVGISIAYALRKEFPHGPNVIVLDKDSNTEQVFDNKCQSIVSSQFFSDEQEIEILKYGAEFFSSFSRHTEIQGVPELHLPYDPLGTLILADSTNAHQVLRNNEKLKMCGIHNKILDLKTLNKKFPWLNVKNVLFGSLGMTQEGVIDPWTFLFGLRNKCINLGVQFVTAEAIDFGFNDSIIKRIVCKLPDGTYNSIDFGCCILAGGIESLNLVNVLNNSKEFNLILKLPLEERMRCEYGFYSENGPDINTPLVVNSDGTYFRREGLNGHYVAGVSSLTSNHDSDVKPYEVFQKKIKPFLIDKIPQLNKIDFCKGWIDVHSYCIANQVGITGPHPETHRLVFALGFTHFGLQYLPALSRAVMEYIYYDDYMTIDFSHFHVENLWRKHNLEAEEKKKKLEQRKEGDVLLQQKSNQ